MKKLLPLGTVVMLHNSETKFMIYGHAQKNLENGLLYDYISCEYPVGNVDSNCATLFNADAISKVFYIGFQDAETIAYNNVLMKHWEEIKNRIE